jgi:hypothetical protein
MRRSMTRPMVALVVCFALVSATTARAEEPKPAPAQAAGGDGFDFELGDSAKKSAAETEADTKRANLIAEKVQLRRKMLVTHQVFGFVTLGLLAVTLVLGTLNYVDKFGGGDYTGTYNTPHLALAVGSSATFTTAALLALLAPNPYPKPIKLDGALFHKVFMALAAACFVTQLVMGPISASREGQLDQRDLALGHLVVGYGSALFMTAGTLAWTFK